MNRFDPYAGLRNGFPPPQEDVRGQVDGDAVAPSPFSPSMQANALLSGNPPWHLWGNGDNVSVRTPGSGLAFGTFTKQLNKVGYGRPDTWHWMFAARLLSANPGTATADVELRVLWSVTVGIGRYSFTLPTFDQFLWTWAAAGPAPVGNVRWSTSTDAGNKNPAVPAANPVYELVAQDIQVAAEVRLLCADAQAVTVELGAFWAPKSHVRPDWFLLDAPIQQQFPGAETGAK